MVPWETVYRHLRRNFLQGQHVGIIGPTGSGKTHIGFDILELRTTAIVIACKPKDPLVDDAIRRGYYLIPTDQIEVEYVDGRPLHKRLIYWPRISERVRRKLPQHQVLAAERAHQRPRVGGALGYVRNDGHWSLMLDEGTWVCRDLRLQADVDSALNQFRTINSSVVVLGQRPAWMGRYVLSQPTHLFLFNTSNRDDRKALGDISGVDHRQVAELVAGLSFEQHEFLYIDTGTRTMFRSVAPPK